MLVFILKSTLIPCLCDFKRYSRDYLSCLQNASSFGSGLIVDYIRKFEQFSILVSELWNSRNLGLIWGILFFFVIYLDTV